MWNVIGLEAGDPPAGAHERNELVHDPPRLWQVDEQQPHMSTVEAGLGQPCIIGVALSDLHLRQSAIRNEAACQLRELVASVDAKHGPICPNALRKKVQNASWSATEVDDSFAVLDSDSIQLRVRIRGKHHNLTLEPLHLSAAPTEQVVVWIHCCPSTIGFSILLSPIRSGLWNLLLDARMLLASSSSQAGYRRASMKAPGYAVRLPELWCFT
ncbi:hypothetical protein AS156_14875 [Bradyrhizobium macuxiense]|uniref:Uncharacterized protein n=1 Tax=Bradyrhizobium macuxiense TaxID=1755647 RepID=A0A120FJY2_9BRAD|nr:hypothetical protein [Bradyrhizobium macuxiense]KWV49817.1 hypothetical protein AS156_14875 [Bradyrhizobium macuxiense]